MIQAKTKNKALIISIFNKKGNSMTSQMLKDLSQILDEASGNENINLILIKSDYDGIFCSGASFDELLEVKNIEDAKRLFYGFAKLMNSMRNNTKLVFCSIDGKVVAGGVGIVSACDFAFATSSTQIKLSELSIGLGAFAIQPAIERKIGISNLCSILLSPKEWKDHIWAEHTGLINKIFESKDKLLLHEEKLIDEYSAYPLNTLNKIKENLWANTPKWEELLYEKANTTAELSLSPFVRDFIQRFKQ